MLYLTEDEVRSLLPMPAAVQQMRLVFEALRDGTAQNQPRRRLILPTGSVLHSLAGAWGNYFGTKFYSTNRQHGAHFLFALYEAKTGLPLALMEANHLGQIRTGAASGYATDLMANPDARTLAVIGSGFQALAQVEAIRAVRPLLEVRVWSRNSENRERFARQVNARATATAEEAVRDAEIVATATNAKDPVLEDHWISEGVHINAMGSNIANRRELPEALVRSARVIAVDSMEQARIEAGDLILPDHWENVVELASITPGWQSRGVTVFKSIGLGVEDVAAAALVYEQATIQGLGQALGSESL